MIKSMTGYGKAQCELDNKKIEVEVRTLNGKNLDINFRIPYLYKERESIFRNLISKILERGKIEIIITVDHYDEHTDYLLNKSLLKKYYCELKELSDEMGVKDTRYLISAILDLPDVVKTQPVIVEFEEWDVLEKIMNQALENTDRCRRSEGLHIEDELRYRIEKISKLLKNIEPDDKQRIEHIKQKMQINLSELQVDYDANRFEQELIYYLEKIDINEEKVRLEKHLSYFTETLDLTGSSNGKKLGFIAQEMSREINTIGSKASDANIQKIVVQMKDELEKIKEQLFNVL